MATSAREGSLGESVSHYTGVRMRVVGTGDLQMRMLSLDNVIEKVMVPFALTATARIQPFRLVNFVQQRAALECKTTEFQEYFRINRIIIYTKPIYSSFPGN